MSNIFENKKTIKIIKKKNVKKIKNYNFNFCYPISTETSHRCVSSSTTCTRVTCVCLSTRWCTPVPEESTTQTHPYTSTTCATVS